MADLPQVFTARQVLTITGVPYSQLNLWIKSGLLQPSVSMAAGSGSRRLYSRGDLFVIRVAWNLRKSGLCGKALRAALDYVCQNFDGFAAIERLGKDMVVKSGKQSVSVLRNPGQLYLDFTADMIKAVAYVSERLPMLPDLAVPSKAAARERMASSARRSQEK